MVLKYIANIFIIASFTFLTACGSRAIMTSPSDKQKVIPVAIEANTAKPKTLDYPNNVNNPEPSIPNTKERVLELPANNIINVLLDKTQKAISLQQWLRAQHILEQAIRLDPNESKVFMLYGDVYSQIGVREQAENMYRRALFLAKEGSEIHAAALHKLDTISNPITDTK